MYKLIKGNLTTFVESLNELPECNIIAFCCSNDGSLLVALVKITKAAIEKEAKAKKAELDAEKKQQAIDKKAEIESKKLALQKQLAEMEAKQVAE